MWLWVNRRHLLITNYQVHHTDLKELNWTNSVRKIFCNYFCMNVNNYVLSFFRQMHWLMWYSYKFQSPDDISWTFLVVKSLRGPLYLVRSYRNSVNRCFTDELIVENPHSISIRSSPSPIFVRICEVVCF